MISNISITIYITEYVKIDIFSKQLRIDSSTSPFLNTIWNKQNNQDTIVPDIK